MSPRLSGVIAAIATPITAELAPDVPRFIKLAQHLLENGCDALNVLGTTGEATSFSFDQRAGVMRAAAAELDRKRLMVGTGAASLAEATALTRLAAEFGFAGALIVPPFYYKDVDPQGVFDYLATIIVATRAQPPSSRAAAISRSPSATLARKGRCCSAPRPPIFCICFSWLRRSLMRAVLTSAGWRPFSGEESVSTTEPRTAPAS